MGIESPRTMFDWENHTRQGVVYIAPTRRRPRRSRRTSRNLITVNKHNRTRPTPAVRRGWAGQVDTITFVVCSRFRLFSRHLTGLVSPQLYQNHDPTRNV